LVNGGSFVSDGILVAVIGMLTIFDSTTHAQKADSGLKDAWLAWESGMLDLAEEVAAAHCDSDEARHLLIFCACAKGKYRKATDLYSEMDNAYEKLRELDDPILHAYLHLKQFAAAAKHAKERDMNKRVLNSLAARTEKPPEVSLDKFSVVPFTEHPLTPYFPTFSAEINGKKTVVHLDTGGTWLILGPERAGKLGITLEDAGDGYHGNRKVKLQRGMAKSFVLGDARLENAPVVGMPTLKGAQDFVIFGTNILQQFHSTLDYPERRLLISPRRNAELVKEQMEAHKTTPVEVPFYMWGDHYMFARGGFGVRKELNFFVDSGLVALDASTGKLRQACFTTTAERYKEWGVEEAMVSKKFFACELPLSLGPLEQKDQYFTKTSKPIVETLGGVRIDGLISHAFLSRYVWTLDFDRMRYVFSLPKKN